MAKRRGPLTPLKEIITGLLNDGTLPLNPDDANIWKIWDEVVGPVVTRNAQPAWIKNGRLKVVVSAPIWLQELKFAADDIKIRLNKKLGRKAIDKIEFKVDPKSIMEPDKP